MSLSSLRKRAMEKSTRSRATALHVTRAKGGWGTAWSSANEDEVVISLNRDSNNKVIYPNHSSDIKGLPRRS
jgi:hypothetical protein